MKALALPLLAVSTAALLAVPVSAQEDSCEQIRDQIKAHRGAPAKPNTILLGKVGANKKCRFSSTEAYRAAWGDKILPKDDRRDRRSRDHGHD